MGEKTRIFVADDHPIFREGIKALLAGLPDIEIVGEVDDGERALELVRRLQPDLVLLDYGLPTVSGLEMLRAIAKGPRSPLILILTAAIKNEDIGAAFQVGVRGLLLKDSAPDYLLNSIRSIVAGRYWLGRISYADVGEVLKSLGGGARPLTAIDYGLTPRELQIVSSVVCGATNKDIAEHLGISDTTVRHHLTSIFNKLGVSNRLELALFVMEKKLLSK